MLKVAGAPPPTLAKLKPRNGASAFTAGLGGAAPQDRKDGGNERRHNSKEKDTPSSERLGVLWVKVRDDR